MEQLIRAKWLLNIPISSRSDRGVDVGLLGLRGHHIERDFFGAGVRFQESTERNSVELRKNDVDQKEVVFIGLGESQALVPS